MIQPNLVLFLVPLTLTVYLHTHIFGIYYYYFDYVTSTFDDPNNVFDFIIVGAGSAGAVLANRLSKNNKVLLLEAGGDPLPMQSIPGLFTAFLHSSYIDWKFETVPQKYSNFGQNKKYIGSWSQGKMLGGSSGLNGLQYVRSHPRDYNAWANISGDDSWSYEKLIPFFKRSLSFYDGDYKLNTKQYDLGESKYGINIEAKSEQDFPLRPYILRAAQEAGYSDIGDLNGPQRTGYGTVELNTKNGARHGTFEAYLKPILTRKNLVVHRYSLATKIKLDKDKYTRGVWYIRHGRKYFAQAQKEVIVSGGAVNSPQLLLLSGIGPKKDLESLNIKSKINLPVGQNLQNHISVLLPPVVFNNTEKKLANGLEDFNPLNFYAYLKHGKGPFAISYASPTQGFLASSIAKDSNWPNIQVIHSTVGISAVLSKEMSGLSGLKEEFLLSQFRDHIGKTAILPLVLLSRPKSSGQILLRNKDPHSYPLIDPNYFEDKRDLQAMLEGIHMTNAIYDSPSLRQLGAHMVREPISVCTNQEIFSDPYWECYIRYLTLSAFHAAGTCAMGKASSRSAVVDSKLRVLHTKGLRVADASIMPDVVNGNTNAACIMIGEKASDMIRQHWAEQYLVSPLVEYLIDSQFRGKCYYSSLV